MSSFLALNAIAFMKHNRN